MIDRRTVMCCAAAVSVSIPRTLLAQATKLPRVVWVGFGPLVPDDRTIVEPWHKAFQELGYVEGRNLLLEYLYVEASLEGRAERLAELLGTLIRQKVDVLFSPRPEIILAAKQATRTIPVVFAGIGDPVGAGLVQSLARPGGNVTGISFDAAPALAGKQLQLLHELVPDGRTLGMLTWRAGLDTGPFIDAAQAAASAIGVRLLPVEVRDASELDAAFASFVSQSVSGVLVLGAAYAWVHREQLAALAARNRLPAIYAMREAAVSGGLMSYGPIVAEHVRRAVVLIDKILKGAKPADLPVEQPSKFDFVVNLKAAKALGIAIPRSLLVRADEIIQ